MRKLGFIVFILWASLCQAEKWEDLTPAEKAAYYNFIRAIPRFRDNTTPFQLSMPGNDVPYKWDEKLGEDSFERLAAVFPELKKIVEEGEQHRIDYYNRIIKNNQDQFYKMFDRNVAQRIRASYFLTLKKYQDEVQKKNPFAEAQALQMTKEKFPIGDTSYGTWDTLPQLFYQDKLNQLQQETVRSIPKQLPKKVFEKWKELEVARLREQEAKLRAWWRVMKNDYAALIEKGEVLKATQLRDSLEGMRREGDTFRQHLSDRKKFYVIPLLENSKEDNLQLHAKLEELEIEEGKFDEEVIKKIFGTEKRNDGLETRTRGSKFNWLNDLAWWGYKKDPQYWSEHLKKGYLPNPFQFKSNLEKFLDRDVYLRHKKHEALEKRQRWIDRLVAIRDGVVIIGGLIGAGTVLAGGVLWTTSEIVAIARGESENMFSSFVKEKWNDFFPSEKTSNNFNSSNQKPTPLNTPNSSETRNYPSPEKGTNETLFTIRPLKGQQLFELPTEFEKIQEWAFSKNLIKEFSPKGKPDFQLECEVQRYKWIYLPHVKGYRAKAQLTEKDNGVELGGFPYIYIKDSRELKIDYYKTTEPLPVDKVLHVPVLSEQETRNLLKVIFELEIAGFKVLSEELENLIKEKRTISLQDIEQVVKKTTLYSYVAASKSWGEDFSGYRNFLNEGVFCGMCGPTNELLKDILTKTLDRNLNIRRSTVFIREPDSNTINESTVHARLYITQPGEEGQLILDATSSKMDPRNPPQSPKAPLIDFEKQKENVEKQIVHQKEQEEKKEERRKAKEEKSFRENNIELPMDYDHKFRFRGQLDLVTHKEDPKPDIPEETPEPKKPNEPEKPKDQEKPKSPQPEKPKPKEIKTEVRTIKPTKEELEAEILRRAHQILEEIKRRNASKKMQFENLEPLKRIVAQNLKALNPKKPGENSLVPHQMVANIINDLEKYVYNKISEEELKQKLKLYSNSETEAKFISEALRLAREGILDFTKKYQEKVKSRDEVLQQTLMQGRNIKVPPPLQYEKLVDPKLINSVMKLIDAVVWQTWAPLEKESLEDIIKDLKRLDNCKSIYKQLVRKVTVVIE